jgi:hypothetical protein
MTYPKWVEKCYVERIRQILGDPVEFGKAVLERKKSDRFENVRDDNIGLEEEEESGREDRVPFSNDCT